MSTMLRIIIAFIYSLVGYAAFITFIILKNYAAASLGFITGVTESILLFLHIIKRRNTLANWYDQSDLNDIGRFGFIIVLVGGSCLAYNTAVEIRLKKGLEPIAESNIIPIIWSFITMKCGLLVIYYTYKYAQPNEPLLTSNDEEEPSETERFSND